METKLDTLEDIQIAYDLLAEEEEEINKHLKTIVCDDLHLLEKVESLKSVHSNLQVLLDDANQLASVTSFTAELAETVSAKVKKLDSTKNRVSLCQRRVEDLLDLQFCTEGVKTALQNEDYEKAAGHVHRFLTLDENVLKSTAKDDKEGSTLDNAFSLLHQANLQLKGIITQRFDEAVQEEDLASVERFFKIFPLLNLHDDGLRRFTLYLCHKLDQTCKRNLVETLATNPAEKRASVIFADTLTLIFEGVARIVEIHQPLVETYYGYGRMLLFCELIQKECDRQVDKLITEFKRCRQLDKRLYQVRDIISTSSSSKTQDKLDPKDIDLLLGELALLSSRTELYLRFVRRRVTADIETGHCDSPDVLESQMMKLDKLVLSCLVTRNLQELMGNYILLEQYFMQESVHKAIASDVMETQVTSMVDDVFFIIKKSIRRALSTSNLDCTCAMINNASTLLEEDFLQAIHVGLRAGFPSGYLDLSQAYTVFQSSIQAGKLQSSDVEVHKAKFLCYLNNADVSVQYAKTLMKSVEQEVGTALPNMKEREKHKMEQCLSQLGLCANKFEEEIDFGMRQLSSSVIKPRFKPWIDCFITTSHDISEDEFSNYEADDPFVQQLITHIKGLLESFSSQLFPGNYDQLVSYVTMEISSQLEKAVLKSQFSRLGGLQFDKELRILVGYLSTITTWSVRDKFARLTQMATLLNLDKVTEVQDYWGVPGTGGGGTLTWRLTPSEVRHVLGLRVDFKLDEIKRLKL